MSPTNFAADQPRGSAKAEETGGKNLLDGLENLLEDLERGKGRLAITMTDVNAFRVGRERRGHPGRSSTRTT